ncbi:hypothetical protein [Sphingomonas glaciei]|uniref:Uncharacterized protein n=1 Tax=Sphingomonas glaciei TaxID=2938948 RepID=A0ABY5MX46_9SPHN|nr:hypothetical protein [Sphingomonas glaciei]UUR08858.1 hypothetical protein M1K48_04285 [Sphingomonas glaciei]
MMKSEPKPFASLSSGLLARKGAARPAMRPQGFGQMGSGLEDLGWNDMGFEPPRPALAPVAASEEAPAALRSNPALGLSPIHAVHVEIAQRLANDAGDEVDETADPVPADPVPADVPPLAELLAAPVEAEPEAPLLQVRAERAPIVVPAAVVAAPLPASAPTPRSRASAGKAKAAFTLRLDQERHLKLRLACAVTGTSAQLLVTRALDELLATMPELDAMASRAPDRQPSKD